MVQLTDKNQLYLFPLSQENTIKVHMTWIFFIFLNERTV